MPMVIANTEKFDKMFKANPKIANVTTIPPTIILDAIFKSFGMCPFLRR